MTAKKSKATKAPKKKSAAKASPATTKADKSQDIVELILKDHKPLKQLIKVLKNSDKPLSEREEAFEQFAPLLTIHAKSEEEALYNVMKDNEDLREEAFEGDVEHGLADQMLEEAKRTDDEDLWSARVKVLAELVEHHIKEEEEELLPDYRKNSDVEERMGVGQHYLELKGKIEAEGVDGIPAEKFLEAEARH